MSIDKTYRCNLCRDPINMDAMHNTSTGIYWVGKVIEARPALQVEHHLCIHCLSSIQSLPRRCGQGYECRGGPKCGSDHK